ncbi:MAG: DUF3313 domain-containing protein [Deltaproteobacteria bacterium]|nr:MAG: DUF3313 domain-containing protein [Deltaproteobacteria bacterium]
MRWHRFAVIGFHGALVAGLATGCATTNKVLKAKPAENSGFLENADQMKENRARAPFHSMWADPAYSASDYGSIQVAPVNTDYVAAQSTWARTNVRQFRIKDDLKMIATEFHETVEKKFKEAKDNRFAVVEAPRGDTLILELAITQLVPNKAFLGAIGLASWAAPAPVGVPVGMLATFADDGWMAIEGRVRDAKTGKVMAMFADREAAKTRVVDVEAITWYGQARESMNDWADQFVLLANTPKDVTVEDSSAFTLLPW